MRRLTLTLRLELALRGAVESLDTSLGGVMPPGLFTLLKILCWLNKLARAVDKFAIRELFVDSSEQTTSVIVRMGAKMR
jgi:hypothetical protein